MIRTRGEGVTTFSLTTLGRFALAVHGVVVPSPTTRKSRALTAFLLMHGSVETAREVLLETFWPDVDPERARDNLSTTLSAIRRSLRAAGLQADKLIYANNSVVRWTANALVDARQFADLCVGDDPAANAKALQLYRGDFLEGDYDRWATAERERLATLYETLLVRAVKTLRDPEAARCLIARNPYAEEAYAVLLETELGAGRSASAVSLIDQCRKALADVGEKPTPAFEERFGHIKLRSLEVPPSNLPRQTTSFVGRDAELAEVEALLAKSQLVTIVGAGGIGKTRVAIQAGAQALHEFDDGVWFADLATMAGEDAVVTEIASAFDVKSSGFSGLLVHILVHLKHKRLLLVLDNCEHVTAEAARVVNAILEACPRVTVLATSRERLGTSGEQVYRLPSLAVPPVSEKPYAADRSLKYGAVALFLARACTSDARFAVTDENAGAVVEICRHLDGIALAIELAAARITGLHVQELVERLRQEFRILKGDDRTAHPRYQTMRATLDWSYEWLSEGEKALFRRLGIFRGGWTLASIRACGAGEGLDEFAILDQLWPLISKSLVAVELKGNSQRYRLLEPLRQYALELLKEQGEYDTTAVQHATYFVEFARREGGKYLQVSDLEFLPAIEEEIDNIRAALEWSLVQGNNPVLGAEIAAALYGFWFTQCYHEGLRLLEAAQAAATPEAYPALSSTIAMGRIRAYGFTDMMAAARVGDEALPTARSLGEGAALVRFLFLHGHSLVSVGRLEEAELLLNEGLQVALRVGDTYRQWAIYASLAKLHRRRGDFSLSRTCIAAMVEAYKLVDLAFDRNRYHILVESAWLEQLDGHLDRALELAREAYEDTRAARDLPGSVQSKYYLGALLFLSGDDSAARTHARSLLKLSTEELFAHGIPAALQLLAGVAVRRGLYDQGARLLGFAEARFAEQTIRRNVWVEVEPDWFLGPLHSHFGDERLAELMAEGERWSDDQAIEEALKI